VSREQIMHCEFASWERHFRAHTLRSEIIPLSQDFVAYLREDGVEVPTSAFPLPPTGFDSEFYGEDEDWANHSESDSEGETESDNESGSATPQNATAASAAPASSDSSAHSSASNGKARLPVEERFAELIAVIDAAIDRFDGAVFPKLNWSAPRDAAWMAANGTLKCQTPGDVFLLLKSSDFIVHDLDHAFDHCASTTTSSSSSVGSCTPVSSSSSSSTSSSPCSVRIPSSPPTCLSSSSQPPLQCTQDDSSAFSSSTPPPQSLLPPSRAADNSKEEDSRTADNSKEEDSRTADNSKEEDSRTADNSKEEDSVLPPIQYTLVLRKWYDLVPGGEFRCFVRDRRIVGISQRQHTVYYEFLVSRRDEYRAQLSDFLTEHVLHHFVDPSFVCDLYVSRTGRVWIVDFNPFCPSTEPLLFDWHELYSVPATAACDFRIVSEPTGVRTTSTVTNRLPHDMANLSNATEIGEFVRQRNEERRKREMTHS